MFNSVDYFYFEKESLVFKGMLQEITIFLPLYNEGLKFHETENQTQNLSCSDTAKSSSIAKYEVCSLQEVCKVAGQSAIHWKAWE